MSRDSLVQRRANERAASLEASQAFAWDRLIVWGLAVVLVGACFGAYSNSYKGVFILDDIPYIDAPRIQTLSLTDKAWGRWVVEYSLALNYAAGGRNVWGYHLVNIIIHALAALVLMGVVRRTMLQPGVSERFRRYATLAGFLTALLWMLHPIQTQSVTYVVQRTESMMSLFFLLVLYCMLRAVDSQRATADSSSPQEHRATVALPWLIAAVVACAVGMVCKQNMVMAPLAAIVFDRIFLAPSWKEVFRRRWGLHVGLVATWAILAAGLFLQPPLGPVDDMPPAIPVELTTPLVYLMSQAGVILHYLSLCFWPQPQCLDYAWLPAKTAADVIPGGIVVLTLALATIWALVRRPVLGFVGLWFFITLAVTSSFFPIADICFVHRMYLALASVILALVLGGIWLADRWAAAMAGPSDGAGKWLPVATLTVVLLGLAGALGIGSYQRNSDYDSDIKMWQDVVAKRPDNPRGLTNLSHYLLEQNQFPKALELCSHSIDVAPAYVLAYINRGNARMGLKMFDGALADFTKAIALRPKYKEAFYNRGNLWEIANQRQLAIDDFTKSIACDPTYGPAYHNRAVSYFLTGQAMDAAQPGSGAAFYRKAWDDIKMAAQHGVTAKPDFMRLLVTTTQPGSTGL